MVHSNDCCFYGNGFLPIEKEGSAFIFGGGVHDIAQGFSQDKDEPVEHLGVLRKCNSVRIGITEEKYPTGTTERFGDIQV